MTSIVASPVIRIHPADDVVIARVQLLGGTRIDSEGITVAGLVPPGHKLAVRAIAAGQPVRRYNQVIGMARADITPGQHVHSHNLEFGNFARDYAVGQGAAPTAYVAEPATFQGIVRLDGRVATRNYIGVLTSVNCSATVARAIADHFRRDIHPQALERYPNVDGVVALTHGAGCATDSEGEPLQMLRRTLGGYARHANFGALLLVGLGCETNQISGLMQQEGLQESNRLHSFSIQDTGGTAKTVARGIELVEWMLEEANRVTAPAGAGQPHHGGSAVRRLRRLQRHQRQPGTGRGGRPAGAPWRHGHPVRIARGLWRRTPADAPRGVRGSGRQAAGAAALVGRLLRAQRRPDGQQPFSRQQGRRADDDPGKEPGRGGQERHHQPGGRLRIRAAGDGQGSGVHGHAGLRPGVGHRPGGRRREPDLLHHRPRLGLRLRAVAVTEAQHQQRAVAEAGRRHRHQLRRGHRRHGQHRSDGRAHLPADAGHRFGPERRRASATAMARASSCPGSWAR